VVDTLRIVRHGDNDPERLVSATRGEEDSSFELKLRPRRLTEFIGQTKAKEQLAIALEAAKSRGEAAGSCAALRTAGTGQNHAGLHHRKRAGRRFPADLRPGVQIQGDLTAILTNLRERQVLFLDEVHRLQPVLEEKLYHRRLRTTSSTSSLGRARRRELTSWRFAPSPLWPQPPRPGLLSSPLRSRFGILLRLEFYTEEELRYVVERSAEVLQVPIDADGASEIALRSRGTPRIANRLLRRVRDYAQVRGTGTIDRATAQAALKMLEVDAHGFDELDRRLLLTIIEKYDGGPVGLNHARSHAGPRRKMRSKRSTSRSSSRSAFLIARLADASPRDSAYEHFNLPMPRKTNLLF